MKEIRCKVSDNVAAAVAFAAARTEHTKSATYALLLERVCAQLTTAQVEGLISEGVRLLDLVNENGDTVLVGQ